VIIAQYVLLSRRILPQRIEYSTFPNNLMIGEYAGGIAA
jgi:hypothetical protein